MTGKLSSLFKRGKFFYVQFKLPDNTYSSAKSTGQTSRNAAERFAIEYLQQGKIVIRESITFKEFSHGFFNWSGSWAMDKRVRGLRISERHCRELDHSLHNLVFPSIGKLRFSAIDRPVIKNFRNNLFGRGYSGATINHALSIIKMILVQVFLF